MLNVFSSTINNWLIFWILISFVEDPKKVKIISYDELLENTNNIMLDTFNFVNLNFENSIYDFIKDSSKYSGDTYSVFRKKKNDNFWKKELDPKINEKIYKDLKKEDLLDYYE